MNTSTAVKLTAPKAVGKPRKKTANISCDLQIETLNPSKISDYQFEVERITVLQAVISDEAKRKALQDYFFHSDNYVFSKSGESSNLLFLRVRRSLRILRDTVTEAEFAAIERNRLDFREALVYGEQTRSAENGT